MEKLEIPWTKTERTFSIKFSSALCLQAAVIRSVAACRAPRRSCCLTVGAWWATPLGTLAATRAMRTWRTVMRTLCRLEPHSPNRPLGVSLVKTRVLIFYPLCGLLPLLRHASVTSHSSLSPLLDRHRPARQQRLTVFPLNHLLHSYAVLSPPLSSPFFPSCRRALSPVPKPRCSWEGARPAAAKPSPPHNSGSAEGENLPDAQNCSHENKLASQSRTQIPSSSGGLSREEFGAAKICLLSGLILKNKRRRSLQNSMAEKKMAVLFAVMNLEVVS